jgi:hypothetical protein
MSTFERLSCSADKKEAYSKAVGEVLPLEFYTVSRSSDKECVLVSLFSTVGEARKRVVLVWVNKRGSGVKLYNGFELNEDNTKKIIDLTNKLVKDEEYL